MKKIRVLFTTLVAIIVLLSLKTSSYAGYTDVDVSENEMYNRIIHFTDENKLNNEQNEDYLIISQMKDIKNINTKNAIIIVDSKKKGEIDLNWVKEVLSNTNALVFFGYDNLECEVDNNNGRINMALLEEHYKNAYNKISKFEKNGYFKVIYDNNQLSYGGMVMKSTDATKMLKNINISEGKLKTNNIDSKIVTKEIEPAPKTANNHYIRFYWSSSTDKNKIYESVNRNGNILVNLYKGEIVYELGGEYEQQYEDYGWLFTYTFTKVHGISSSGSYVTGYMIIDGMGYCYADGDGWWSDQYGFNLSKPLWNIISSENDGTNVYVRTQNSTTYYGTKIKSTTSIYNSSGSYLTTLYAGNWVWMTASQNMCGASNHHYMTIKGYSTSASGTINTYSSTTFVNAGFNTSNPANYKISTRWW